MLYGYARVSTLDQQQNGNSLQTQRDHLINFGVPPENIVEEVISGQSIDREGLNKLIEILSPGDTLVVFRLDRFARSVVDALAKIEELNNHGIYFQALDIGQSTDPAVNQLTMTVFLALSEFETRRRRQRQLEGIEIAKKKGKYKGRVSVITPELVKKIDNYKKKNLKVTEIAKLLNVSRTTIYKATQKKF